MKPSAVLLSLIFGVSALVATVWLGRYPAMQPAGTSSPKDEDLGPKPSSTGPHPKAVVDATEFDFGTLPVGLDHSHTFTIRNEGEADLKLVALDRDRTCQCTGATLAHDNAIPPGGSIDVTVTWQLKTVAPAFRHSATLRTNDPEQRAIKLEITGKVEDGLHVSPAGAPWEVGELKPHESSSVTGTVHSTIFEEFAIERFECGNPLVSVKWEPLNEDQQRELKAKSGYAITATVGPGTSLGPFAERVKLITSVKELPEVEFVLSGNHHGPLEFFGPGYRSDANVVQLGEFKAKDGKNVTLSVFARDFDGVLELTETKQVHGSLQVELVRPEGADGKGNRYLLKIKVPPGEPQNRQRKNSERLDLYFNHPEAKHVRLHVDFLSSDLGV
jgi:hypothetical protein